MAVIVVDVLEIVDVEKGQREVGRGIVALQQFVDAMLDHPPRRQVGQLVIIGGTKQLILDRLLFGDIGGGRQQQFAIGDAHRPMAREQDLFVLAVADGFFGDRGAARAQQFETGFATMLQFASNRSAAARGDSELCGRGIVDQQEAALLVLNGDAAGSNLKTSRRMPSSP